MSTTTVTDNSVEHRFETIVEGCLAQLVYRLEGERLTLVHTEVPDELSGRGIGGDLVLAAVAAADRGNLVVVPQCPFALGWLRRHPDEAGRITVDWPDEQ